MLGFITTDIDMPVKLLDRILKKTVTRTFNNLTIDGDTSTNDMVLLLANGYSGISLKKRDDLALFEKALFAVCNALCAKIAEDGEGATKRIEVRVTGGRTYNDCQAAAKAVANSNLVKTALFGNDPNWGRILCAVGYSGARFSQKTISVTLGGLSVYHSMSPAPFPVKKMVAALKRKVVTIDINLGHKGNTCATAHTCDLSYDYIKINAEYHT
jgi:glutamate N-acetyltransferase/amino-acid N-acetyltransferase